MFPISFTLGIGGPCHNNTRFVGAIEYSYSGHSVSSIKDLNNDGKPDIIIGARADADESWQGATYVVSGAMVDFTTGASIALTPAPGIVRLVGEYESDEAGTSVSSIGDLNNDGKPELLIGAVEYPNYDGYGATYVVSGAMIDFTAGVNITLASAPGIVRFVGENFDDNSGCVVSSIGDLNADGKPELLIGACDFRVFLDSYGATYVVSGAMIDFTTGASITLTPAPGIVRFVGENLYGEFGHSVNSIGDLNADGKPELLIGANHFGAGGATYVISGAMIDFTTGSSITATLAPGIVRFVAENIDDHLGVSVSSIEDLNNDGKPELLIGANRYLSKGDNGATYVISGAMIDFTTGSSITLTPAPGIVRFVGENIGDYLGISVSSIGDLNGDGKPELLFSATSYPGINANGAVYVVSGAMIDFTTGTSITLNPGAGIGRLVGENKYDDYASAEYSGSTVSSIGDLNGDGKPELLIGQDGYGSNNGVTYVVSGDALNSCFNLSQSASATSPSSSLSLSNSPSSSPSASISPSSSVSPSPSPSESPSPSASASLSPSESPSLSPSLSPSVSPSPSESPSPSASASLSPSESPSLSPSLSPSVSPSPSESPSPSVSASLSPSESPSLSPSLSPSVSPSPSESPSPSASASLSPSESPSLSPSLSPSASPSPSESPSPSASASLSPSELLSSRVISGSNSIASSLVKITESHKSVKSKHKTIKAIKTSTTLKNTDLEEQSSSFEANTVTIKPTNTPKEGVATDKKVDFFQQGHGHVLLELNNLHVLDVGGNGKAKSAIKKATGTTGKKVTSTSTGGKKIDKKLFQQDQDHHHKLVDREGYNKPLDVDNNNDHFRLGGRDATSDDDSFSVKSDPIWHDLPIIHAAQIPLMQVGFHLLKQGYNGIVNLLQGTSNDKQAAVTEKLLTSEQATGVLNNYNAISKNLENVIRQLELYISEDNNMLSWFKEASTKHKHQGEQLLNQPVVDNEAVISYCENIEALAEDLSGFVQDSEESIDDLVLSYIKAKLAEVTQSLSNLAFASLDIDKNTEMLNDKGEMQNHGVQDMQFTCAIDLSNNDAVVLNGSLPMFLEAN